MNTTEIATYIKEPQNLGTQHVDALRDLCQNHPYSGLLHVLYLKALSNMKSIDFERNLQDYAIKIPNRELLYFLIHDEQETSAFVENVSVNESQNEKLENESVFEFSAEWEVTEINSPDEESKIEFTNNGDSETLSFDENEVHEDQLSNDNNENLTQQDFTHLENEDELDGADSNNTQTKDAPKESRFTLDEVSWLDNNITFDGFDGENQPDSVEEISEETSINFDFSGAHSADVAELKTEPEVSNFNEEIETRSESSNKRKSFYDWLNISAATQEKNLNPTDDATVPITEEGSSEDENQNSSNQDSKEKVQSLVDKFIETEPRISRPKAEFFSPVKNAKESVSEEGIPVSETLAKIYELQGNYPKAISVLERLIELIPQKKSLFQEKIAELNRKVQGE